MSSYPHKSAAKFAVPRKLTLGHFKKVKIGFYAMNRKSVQARSFARALSEPDIRNTNPSMDLEVVQFDKPGPNVFEFTLIDDTHLSFKGEDFDMKEFLYQHELKKFQLRSKGVLSAMEQDLIKTIDNEE